MGETKDGLGGEPHHNLHPSENFQNEKNYTLPDALVVEMGPVDMVPCPLPFLNDAQHCPTLKAAPKLLRSIFIKGIVHIHYCSDGCCII